MNEVLRAHTESSWQSAGGLPRGGWQEQEATLERGYKEQAGICQADTLLVLLKLTARGGHWGEQAEVRQERTSPEHCAEKLGLGRGGGPCEGTGLQHSFQKAHSGRSGEDGSELAGRRDTGHGPGPRRLLGLSR